MEILKVFALLMLSYGLVSSAETTGDPIADATAALPDLATVCPSTDNFCVTEHTAVDNTIKAPNEADLCRDFKAYLDCIKENCNPADVTDADGFMSTHCSATDGSGNEQTDGPGENTESTQAPTITTADPFVPGQAALSALSLKCIAKTANDDCDTEPVDKAISATNQTALCSTFKTYFDCTKDKCEDNADFRAATDVANKFLSTHCNSAVLAQGSMALAITLAWLSAYISGKL